MNNGLAILAAFAPLMGGVLMLGMMLDDWFPSGRQSLMGFLRRLACRWLGLRDPREWAASENRLMALHDAESYALEVEIEERVGKVPEALRRLDAALEPYMDQRRCVEMLPVQELVWGEWPEEQEGDR